MADDVKETLISCIRCTKFALQMDELGDITGLKYCADICIDGAKALMVQNAGAIAKIKRKGKEM